MRANSSGIFNRVVRLLNIAAMLCIGTTVYSQRTVPDPYPEGTPVNYIKTWDAAAPDPDGNYITQRPLKDVKLTTQYIDGLGRPFQTVARKGSLETGPGMLPKDMVVMQQYDELGREAFKYLPYAETTGNDGTFKTDPFAKQAAFMNATYGTGIQNETWYYAQTEFEASPLNRPVKQMAAGNSWVGAARGVVTKYWNNTLTDAVKKWEINTDINQLPTFPVGTPTGSYNAGELIKTITEDEHGKQVIEFKDRDGKVILKKVQLTGTADDGTGRDYTGWLCTYYLYDIYNNLRCVVQPKGVELLNDNLWNLNALSGTILAEQCFQYGYDGRNHMTVKKVPGAGEVYMVYDNRDRLVATSDANGRSGAYTGYCYWLFTLYDELNRPVATGEMHSCMNFTAMQSYVNGLNNGSVTFNTQPGTAMSLTAWNPVVGNSICSACSNWYIGTISHYDDYTALPSGLSSFLTTWNTHFADTDNSNWPYPQLVAAASTATKGMVTWMSSRILGTANFLNTVNYYDEKGRVIQVQSTNITGGTDVVTTQYSWAGQPLVSVQKQTHAISDKTIVIVSKNTYDDLGRLVKTDKKQSHTDVDGNAMSAYKTIAELKYDKLGQLSEKKLTPAYNSGAGLETLAYDYNIRGWMLGMNKDYITSSGQSGTKHFGFELGYDKTGNSSGKNFTAGQYDGNITGMVWKSDGDDVRRKYDFNYDPANRLLQGLFEQDDATANWNTTSMNYSIKMGNGTDATTAYDANGNIKAMTQFGFKIGASVSTPIDNLSYNYIANTNRLLNVIDANNDATTKLGDFRASSHYQESVPVKNTATADYVYDANGNLTKDLNKDIKSISYNHLNVPSVIIFDNGMINHAGAPMDNGIITYTYDAAGNKLKKVVQEYLSDVALPIKTTLYINGMVYEDDILQFIPHEEGRIRIRATDHTFQYDYMIKDHLGNVRMVLTEEVKPLAPYKATMETALNGFESSLFDKITETRETKPGGFDADGANEKVSKLFGTSGSDKRMGPGVVLKVMAGDKFTAKVFGWYQPGATDITQESGLSAIANGIISSLTGGIAGIGKTSAADITGSGVLGTTINQFLPSQPVPNTGAPKAYLNWVVLDEAQFKLVSGNYGAVPIPTITSGMAKQLMQANNGNEISITKNGYLYVFVSNESKGNVYFDDLLVEHITGSLLEETHYYPFGLTMAGISSRAAGNFDNKVKFTSQLLDDDFGINIYQMKWRTMDPQIGRFLQIDPLTEKYVHNSTYAYAENDVIRSIDLEGLEKLIITHEKVSGNVRKIIAERIVRNGQMQDNNITIKNDNGTEVKITKNVLVLQNNLREGGKKRDIVQQDNYKGYELIVKSGERTTETVKGNSPASVGIDIRGEGNKVLTRGDSFENEGDTYVSTVGYVAGQTNFVKTQSQALNIVKGQITELTTAVPNISLDKFNISISGTQGSLPDLKRVAESIRLSYPGANVTVNPSTIVENKNKINFNVTISAVTN